MSKIQAAVTEEEFNNGKIYKCETCSKTFPSSILKHKHKFEEHQSGLECEFCKLSFTGSVCELSCAPFRLHI